MELLVGDRLVDETGEWEIINRPHTAAGGRLVQARVRRSRGILTLPTSKSGKPRFVELASNVLRTLRAIPGQGEHPLIFPDRRKISHRFPRWAAEAKLPGKVTLHTLRHSFASRLVMAGVDLLTVKALGGWNRLEMVERYSHWARAHKRAAVERLAQADPLHPASGTQSGTGGSAGGEARGPP